MSDEPTLTILHVEDDEANRESLGRMLQLTGFKVWPVATGADALRRATEQPDVILLDVRLPDIDGFEVCRRLKADPSTANIPVLQHSAHYVSNTDRIVGLEGGADAFMTKTAHPRELIAQIRALGRVRRAESELEERIRQQQVVVELNQLALAGPDLQSLLHTITRRVTQVLHLGHCQILELLPTGGALLLREGAGWREGQVGLTTVSASGDSQAAYALRTSEAVHITDLRRETRFRPESYLLDHGLVSGLAVKIAGRGSPLGLLGVYSTQPRSFSAADVDFLQAVALLLGTVLDRQRMEQTVRWLAAIVESSDDAIVGKTLDGIITTWNPGATRLYGWSAAEALGQSITMLAPPDRREEVLGILDQLRRGQHIEPFETVRLRKDGKAIAVALTISVVRDAAGAVAGASTIAHDISRRKVLEEQLRQAQKMEAIGHLAGGVAHDFNNLLTVITGYSELLLTQMGSEHPSHGSIVEILKASDRAAALTRQLLAYSRKQILQPVVVNWNNVLAGLEKMLRRLIGEHIELITCPDPALGAIRADPNQLEQILLNLAINARDAMPGGGTLTIATHNVALSEDYAQLHVGVYPGPYALLAVSDTGVGMSAEVQAHLFEPFFTTKEVGKGTGLGLATIHGIVQQSEGHVEVSSEVGRGTTFRIYLPRLKQPSKGPSLAAADLPCPRGTETILLAEDEPGVRSLTQTVLESCGYTLLVATDGQKALDLAHQHQGPLQLLLTDVIMPQVNGRRLADLLRAVRPTLKVLYLSGYAQEAIGQQGVLEGSLPFLQKPFTPTTLARKVRELLDQP
jgi:two-component system cell cycle sensor histidine kinase/response regulator CckA